CHRAGQRHDPERNPAGPGPARQPPRRQRPRHRGGGAADPDSPRSRRRDRHLPQTVSQFPPGARPGGLFPAPSMRPFRPRGLALAALLLMLSSLAGCGATPHSDRLLAGPSADLPPRHELTEVPFHPQEAYQCGPAALATVLQHSGVDTSPEALEPRIYVPGRQGSFQVEILAATRRAGRLAHLIAPDLEALLRAVAAGQPVLVLQNLGLDWYPQWHYAVVVGYDLAKRQVVLRSGVTERYHMPLKLFERTWRRGELWGMVALAPGELPVDDDGKGYFLSAAAFE